MHRWILCLTLLFAQPLWAETSQEPQDSSPEQVPAQEEAPSTSKEQWLRNVNKMMPGKMCQQDMDFVQCFETTQEECENMVEWFATACLNQVGPKLPEQVDVHTGEQWGRMTGRCVYDLYHKFLAPKRVEKEGCPKIAQNNPSVTLDGLPDPTAPDHAD